MESAKSGNFSIISRAACFSGTAPLPRRWSGQKSSREQQKRPCHQHGFGHQAQRKSDEHQQISPDIRSSRVPHIGSHREQSEEGAQHVLAFRNPRHRFDMQRMHGEQRGHKGAAPSGPGHPLKDEKQQERVEQMKRQIDDVIRSAPNAEQSVAPLLFVMLLDCIINDSLKESLGWAFAKHAQKSTSSHSMSLRMQQRTESSFWSVHYLALQMDLCLVAGSVEDAQAQLHSLQSAARACGLEINMGKNKTEIAHFRCDGQIHTIDGVSKLQKLAHYTYLGLRPDAPRRGFPNQNEEGMGSNQKLDQLWKAHIQAATKIRLLQSLVLSVFLYGCQTWPSTQAFYTRLDQAFTRMLRYCLHEYDTRECYLHGAIPHISSVVVQRKVALAGHAMRHPQALSFLLHNPQSRRGRTANLERELRKLIPCEQQDWDIVAQDRSAWHRLGEQRAREHEEQCYRRINAAREKRWKDIERVQTRVNLYVLESCPLPMGSNAHVQQVVQDFSFPPHQNVFAGSTSA